MCRNNYCPYSVVTGIGTCKLNSFIIINSKVDDKVHDHHLWLTVEDPAQAKRELILQKVV